MFDPLWLLIGVALTGPVLTLLSAVDYWRHLRIPGMAAPEARVALVLPATGRLAGFERLLECLRAQTLRPQRLIISVESETDPAYCRVCGLRDASPDIAIEIVVAGVSNRRAQKCTNILAAIERLGPEDEYVIFIDADIHPQPWFVGWAIAPLILGAADIVNGYRWLVPDGSPMAMLVAAFDREIGILPRFKSVPAIWGGAIAVNRRTLDALALPSLLDREVVEDAPIARHAHALGLRVVTRNAIRLPTGVSGSARRLWAFARRQLQYTRLYGLWLWCIAAVIASAGLSSRTALIVVAAAVQSPAAIGALVAIALLGSLAVEIRTAIGRKFLVSDPLGFRLWQHLMVWMILPGPALFASLICGTVSVSTIRWAHVHYRVDRAGRVIAAQRFPHQ